MLFRSLLPLLAHFEKNALTTPEARGVLVAFLRHGTPEIAQRLESHTRLWLIKLIPKSTITLGLEILSFLKDVVGEESLQPLDRLQKRSPSHEIRQSAEEVLMGLWERIVAENLAHELLHASEMPDQKEELLRPLKENYDPQEAQELLQAVEHPTDER